MLTRYRKLELRRFFQTALVLLLINLLVFPPWLTAGSPVSWTGNGDGFFFGTAGNWDTLAVPDVGSDATIASGGVDNVNLDVGGYSLNSMVIGGTDPSVKSTLNVYSTDQPSALTLSTGNPITGDVLTIANGGILNVQQGAGVTLDLSSGGTVTNKGQLNVTDGSILNLNPASITEAINAQNVHSAFTSNTYTINNVSDGTTVGTISLGESTFGTSGSLVLNDPTSAATFKITGGGQIVLSDNPNNFIYSNSGSSVQSVQGASSVGTTLQLDGQSLSGAGQISVDNLNLTGDSSLNANSSNALNVFSNLKNWDGATSSLTGGQYIANSGSQLLLSSLGSSSIQNITNASFLMSAGGFITGDGSTVPLSSLTNITNSTVSVGGLNGGDSVTPFVITPVGGTLTMLANDSGTTTTETFSDGQGGSFTVLVAGSANLTLDNNSNVTIDGTFHNLTVHDNFDPAFENASTLNVFNGSTLTTGAFINEASVNGPGSLDFMNRTSIVNVTGNSILNIASLTTTTDNGWANSQFNIDNSQLNVYGSVIQGGGTPLRGGDNQGGFSGINLTNGATSLVTGDFQNNSDQNSANLSLDGGSSMIVNGAFTQHQNVGNGGQSFLILNNSSTLSVGSLTNSTGVGGDGVPQSHVWLDNGSSLTVTGPSGSATNFTNVGDDGTLSGGDYVIGAGSKLIYAGADIKAIGANTVVTLAGADEFDGSDSQPATGQFVNGSHNALSSSLTANYGTLNLGKFYDSGPQYGEQAIGNLTVDITNSNRFTNGTPTPSQIPGHVNSRQDVPVGGVININEGSTLTFQDYGVGNQSTIYNYGAINLNGAFDSENYTTLALDGGPAGKNFILNGSGTLLATDSFGNTLTGVQGNDSLTNNSNIQGSVYIQNFQQVTNNGSLTADGGAGITVDLTNGGAFTNGSTGVVTVNNGSALVFVSSNSTNIINDGSIFLNGGCGCEGGASLVFIDAEGAGATFTLGVAHANGTLTMDSGGNNFIVGLLGTENLVNDTGHTIQGSGLIGGFASFTNNGTLLSNVNNFDDFGHPIGLTIDLTGGASGDPNETFTNNGEIDVSNGSTLYLSSLGDKTIVNNGSIYLGGAPDDPVGHLVLGSSDDLEGTNFTFARTNNLGEASIHMTAGSTITGWYGDENLINGAGHTIYGAGTIQLFNSDSGVFGNVTNNGTLQATGGTFLVNANLTNWDGSTGKLTGGDYVADDGSILQLNSLGGGTQNQPPSPPQSGIHTADAPAGAILTLSGATVTLTGSGRIHDVNGNDALANLSQIDQGDTGIGRLTLNLVGAPGSPYTITTSQLTVSADDTRVDLNQGLTTNATLFLDGSYMKISNGDSGFGDLVSQATSTTGNIATTNVTLVDAASLEVGNFSNTAAAGVNDGSAFATVGLTGITQDGILNGSLLTVHGNLTNTATSTDSLSGQVSASIKVSQNSHIEVLGDLTNSATGVAGLDVVSASILIGSDIDATAGSLHVTGAFNNNTDPGLNGAATLRINNGSTVTVDQTFGNSAGSSVTIDGSTLNTGDFTNSGFVTLINGAALNATVPTTGGLTNYGLINLEAAIGTDQHGAASGHISVANSVNVTGDLFNTSAGVINVNGAGDSVNVYNPLTTSQSTHGQQATATGQFVNAGKVNLNGNNTYISADSFDNQAGTSDVPGSGTVNFNGTGSSLYTVNGATNEGTMNFGAHSSIVSSSGFTNNGGDVNVFKGSDVSFLDVDTQVLGSYSQTAGTTFIDSKGTLAASEVNIAGGLLTGGGTIVGDVCLGGSIVDETCTASTGDAHGTISPGDPQSMTIIGNYTQVLPGIMDLNFDATSSDQILVEFTQGGGGNVTLGGTLELTLGDDPDSFNPLVASYMIISWAGSEVGDFSSFEIGGNTSNTLSSLLFNHGTEYFTEYRGNAGELDLLVNQVTSATPEPSTLAMLFGASLLGAGAAWRKRRYASRTK